MPLRAPPRNPAALAIRTVRVTPTRLFRVSRFRTGEPYFGKSAANRFDDPSRVKLRRYGTCYFGLSLTVAIAETVLHDEMPNCNGVFEIAQQEFDDRYWVRLVGEPLVLADLTGVAAKTTYGDGSISTVIPYDMPQQWSRAIHRHPLQVHGILYMSRHVNDHKAIVLFDRASKRLRATKYQPLPDAPGAARAKASLRIEFDYR